MSTEGGGVRIFGEEYRRDREGIREERKERTKAYKEKTSVMWMGFGVRRRERGGVSGLDGGDSKERERSTRVGG